jgi:hypothetical protein
MTLEQRLEKVERENRWMRRIGMVAAAVAAAVFLIGQGKEELDGLGFEELAKLVANDKLPDPRRAAALEMLGRLDDAPREKVRDVAIGLFQNRAESTYMRGKAVAVVWRKPYADERTWDAMEVTILQEQETNGIVQRMCLNALGRLAPLDRVEKLLAKRQVYGNAYFGFRIDVASALSALNLREKFALDILCEYLVDDDPADKLFKVRQEAWLSLWTLTGKAYGVTGDFDRAPKRHRDKESTRHYLWRTETTRPGVWRTHIAALKRVTPDLEKMRAICDSYRKLKDALLLARTQCKELHDKAMMWKMITRKPPESLVEMVAPLRKGDPEKFMYSVPEDPWGRPYRLSREERKIRIYSLGEDGRRGSDDDIVYPEGE